MSAHRRRGKEPVGEDSRRRRCPDYPLQTPPAHCEWKRPSWLYQTKQYNLYIRAEFFDEVKDTLLEVSGSNEALKVFKSGVLGRLMEYKRNQSSNIPLHHTLVRQLKSTIIPQDEIWFQLGHKTVRFTPWDYALITGLHFGNSNFNPYAPVTTSLESVHYRFFEGRVVMVNELRDMFVEQRLGDDIEDYLKVANLLTYYLFLCGRGNIPIEDWVWFLVEDFEQWDAFPWGAWTYGILEYYVNNVLPDDWAGKDVHFYGPVWALQLWTYEVIPDLGRSVGQRREGYIVPRACRWRTGLCKADFSYYFDNPELEIQPLTPTEYELDTYYMMSFDNGDPFDVRYRPPPRMAVKGKAPATKKTTMGKLKQLVGKGAPKRTRQSTPPLVTAQRDEQEAEQDERVCCVHGNPCPLHQNDEDDDTIRKMKYVMYDESDTGFMARMIRKMSQVFVLKQPSPHPQQSFQRPLVEAHRHSTSAVGGLRHSPPEMEQPRHSVAAGPSHSHHSHRSHHSQHEQHAPFYPEQQAPFYPEQQALFQTEQQAPFYPEQQALFQTEQQATSHHSHHSGSRHSHRSGSRHSHRSGSHHSQREQQAESHHSYHTPQIEQAVDSMQAFESMYQNWGQGQSDQAAVQGEQALAPDDIIDEDIEEEVPQQLGPRERRPGRALQSPYEAIRSKGERLMAEYRHFRSLGPQECVTIEEVSLDVDNNFFSDIERPDYEFEAPVIDLFILSLRKKLRNWVGTKDDVGAVNTILIGTDLYAILRNELRGLHSNDVWFKSVKGKPSYSKWVVPEAIDRMIKGLDTPNAIPWSSCSQILTVCNPWLNHWVALRIDIDEWEVEVYDSKYGTYDHTMPSLIEDELKPITRLLPVALARCGFWDATQRHKRDGAMSIVKIPAEAQIDDVSCGVFACMYLDHIISTKRPNQISYKYIQKVRRRVAHRIFWLSRPY